MENERIFVVFKISKPLGVCTDISAYTKLSEAEGKRKELFNQKNHNVMGADVFLFELPVN